MMGMTTGVSVVISQYYGAGKKDKVAEAFVTSIYVVVAMVIVITIAGIVGTEPLLRLLQTSEDLIEEAVEEAVVEAMEEATMKNARKTATQMIKKGKLTLEEIAEYVPDLSMEELQQLETEIMQLT